LLSDPGLGTREVEAGGFVLLAALVPDQEPAPALGGLAMTWPRKGRGIPGPRLALGDDVWLGLPTTKDTRRIKCIALVAVFSDPVG
jgi:hypothetical protein